MSEAFQGTLVTVPFGARAVRDVVVDRYRRLVDDHDPEDVLVVSGSPTSSSTYEALLDDEVPGAAVPRVSSLVVEATDVLGETDERTILSDALRRELLHRFVDDYDWDAEYFCRAAGLPSFPSDVSQLLETASWHRTEFDTTPELVEVGQALDAFHDWLADHDHLERGQLVSEAVGVLEDEERRDAVVDVEAVLAVEFQEFFPLDRRYLQALADGLDLVCVAETVASVGRTRVEPGPIGDHVSFTTEVTADGREPASRPAATAAFWARGDVPSDPGSGSVEVIATETADGQLTRVADEIERLREDANWDYDDVAVATQYGGSGTTDALRALERSGLPTESTTVVGFGDDPAVHELLQVVRYLASGGSERAAPREATDRLDESTLAEVAATDGLADPLRRWATESGLKRRIAVEADPLDARSQFGNVRRVFRMAEFVEETAFLETSWESFAEMLERAHEYAPQLGQTSATERDGGVRVDHVEALEDGRFRAVFLVNLVDSEYPGDPWLTGLFPQERVARMPDYPAVTDVTEPDVDATFPTDSTESSRPFRRYYTEQARRRLAVGAAAATERLYCCLYEYEDTALEERAQPSRFLTEAYRRLPWLSGATDGRLGSERAVEESLLSRVDRALADVRRSRSQDVTVSLDALESDLGEVQTLLADSGDRGDRLRRALRARVDFARGRVRRE